MAGGTNRQRFGNVRKLPSGRWQVRYWGGDGVRRSAPETFERKTDAQRYLSLVEAQIVSGGWTDPARAKVRLGDYASLWISQRAGLRPRTVALYDWLLKKHISPYLGSVELGKLDTARVREWRMVLLGDGVSASVAAKAYRLLRAVLMTAAKDDRIIPRNPCQVRGADQEKAPERPVLSVSQVFALADQVPPRFRALILLATFASLRYGEVIALQRQDLDLDAGAVAVRQSLTEITGQGLVLGPPKSRAGRRAVAIPSVIMPVLRHHLDLYVPSDRTSYVFTGPKGGLIRRGNFNKLVKWREKVSALGAPGFHFHDLRHTGNTLAAASGVSTRDLMARMGHDSMAAALIYQHATSQADRAIADALDTQARAHREESEQSVDDDDGSPGVSATVA